jgi:hypothetical protein
MKNLLAVSGVLEVATGLSLVLFPSTIAALLLGAPLDAALGLTVARVAGVALLALGAACWFARLHGHTPVAKGIVEAMLLYNVGIVAVFGYSAVVSGVSGIGLWPVVVTHVAMTGWCLKCILGSRS